MAVEIDIQYSQGLHTLAKHGPSGMTLTTDAPVDNGGQGESFSPTDLVATALGTCVMTILALVANRHEISLRGTTVHVKKEMITSPIRRIGALPVDVSIPAGAVQDASMRTRLEEAAKKCPVHQSLHPDIDAPIRFHYG